MKDTHCPQQTSERTYIPHTFDTNLIGLVIQTVNDSKWGTIRGTIDCQTEVGIKLANQARVIPYQDLLERFVYVETKAPVGVPTW